MDLSSLREKINAEKVNIKGLSRQEAVSYIFTYYGLAMAAILVVLIFIISFAVSVHQNKMRVPVVTLGLLQNYDAYGRSVLEEDLADAFPETDKNTAPQVMSFYDPNSSANGMGAVQLIAYLSAGELDAMVCDKATYEYLTESDLFYYPDGSDFPGYDISETKLGQSLISQGATEVYYLILDEDGLDEAVSFAQYLLENG